VSASPDGEGHPRPASRSLDRGIALGFAAATLAVRLPFWGRYPTEWDSAQFVMALDRFDVRQHLPHSPGYWLYVALGRLVRALSPLSGHRSLLLVTALGSAATVAVTYVAGRDIGGRWLGLAAAGFLLTSPFAWFYGAVAGTYGFDALADVSLLVLAWRARPGSRHGLYAALVLGLAAGLRQMTPILLAPLALVAAVRSVRSLRAAAAAAVAGLAATLVWIVPLALEQPGGLPVWRAVSSEHWHADVSSTSPLAGAPLRAWGHNLAHASAYGLAATAPLLVLAAAGRLTRLDPLDRRALPMLLACALTASVLLLPVENLLSRRIEAEADWTALQATHDPASMQALQRRLALTNRSSIEPPRWAVWLLFDHPPVMDRIAAARSAG
jgi:hypothetical protein